uniref:Ovule protein n=1 Tax=Mesocestoides corti TaxID=53468 RepID=A0A5K3FBC0_MESCO
LLTNHKPKSHVRSSPFESTTLATSLFIYYSSFVSLVDCISSSHAIGSQSDRGLSENSVIQNVCALIRRHWRIHRRLPSESSTLATMLIIYCTSVVSFSGWLLIFFVCH